MGIVVHLAMRWRAAPPRTKHVVHHYHEVLLGDGAMERGPVMLSWQAVQDAAHHSQRGANVVVHEFVHKMDMRNGPADGYPPLPATSWNY